MFKKTVETFALLLFVIQCHGAVTQLAGILRDVEERLQPLYPSTLSTGSPRPCCIEAVVKEERTFIARMDCPGFNNKYFVFEDDNDIWAIATFMMRRDMWRRVEDGHCVEEGVRVDWFYFDITQDEEIQLCKRRFGSRPDHASMFIGKKGLSAELGGWLHQ